MYAIRSYYETAVSQFQLTQSDNVLQFASIGFDTSLEETCPTHLSGATLILRTEESLSSIQAFLNFCHIYQISVLDLPTAFWHTLTIEMQRDVSLQLPVITSYSIHYTKLYDFCRTVSVQQCNFV